LNPPPVRPLAIDSRSQNFRFKRESILPNFWNLESGILNPRLESSQETENETAPPFDPCGLAFTRKIGYEDVTILSNFEIEGQTESPLGSSALSLG
jgi:hypothetical protein